MLGFIHSICIAAALVVASFPPTADAKVTRLAKAVGTSKDFTGTVVRVADGDTYIVRRSDGSEVKVRLHWADCPEIAHTKNEVDQPGGQAALACATGFLLKRKVSVHATGESYGRIVGDVKCEGNDVAEFLVCHGDAMLDRRYKPSKALVEIEADAKGQGFGVWSNPTPTPPWEWRKMTRDQQIKARK